MRHNGGATGREPLRLTMIGHAVMGAAHLLGDSHADIASFADRLGMQHVLEAVEASTGDRSPWTSVQTD